MTYADLAHGKADSVPLKVNARDADEDAVCRARDFNQAHGIEQPLTQRQE